MKEKEMYTFEELCSNLEISMSQFCKRSSTDAGTIARIRQGELTRLSTANRLLRAFSEVYERELSFDNVEGLRLQNPPIKKPVKPPMETSMPIDIHTAVCHQISIVEPSSDIPAHLPPGTIKMIDFAEAHGVRKERMREWIVEGLGGEKIETTFTMVKRLNGGSRTHFLTPEQQEKALEFLIRHGKLKTSQPKQEQPIEEERLWHAPDGE